MRPVLLLSILLIRPILANAGTEQFQESNPEALGYVTFELASEVVHGSWTNSTPGQGSFTSANFLARVDGGLLELALSSEGSGGTRIGDYEGFTFGLGGASNDALLSGFDLMYEVNAGLRAEVSLSRDLELRVRGGLMFTGDIARDTASGRATWAAWQAGAGVRYHDVYVEGGPDIVFGSGGSGVQAMAYYRFRRDAAFFKDAGVRVEHISGNRDDNAGQPYSETLINLFFGTH
jgi:hypothetical protein